MEIKDSLFYQMEYKKLQILLDSVDLTDTLYFYGAGLRSEEILQMQKEGYRFLRRPDAFLVTEKVSEMGHVEAVNGIPVYLLSEVDVSGKHVSVVVIAMKIYQDEIGDSLRKAGCQKIYFLTDAMEHLLTRDFLKFYFEKNAIKAEFQMFDEKFKIPKDGLKKDIHTYSVMCERDSSTKVHFERLDWISELQAGAVYARNIVAEYRDDTGEHISNLNSYYNELTGLYWVWKNTSHDYTGICHYRRRFESEIALLPLLEDKTDVVLPLPFVVGQDLRTYYQHWGYDEYYDMMLEVIRERFADYYETACWCAKHIVFLPNNICIAKREVLEEYCDFLFGVIDEVEVRIKTTDIRKQNRCWLSEHVTTVYFMHYLKSHPVYFANLKRIW